MFNVALVGAGYIGQNHIAALGGMDDVKITAVICRSVERGEAVAKDIGGDCKHYKTLEDALAAGHIDVVDICTPTNVHEEYVVKAANAKCHVLCEKPVTFDLQSFDRMYAACKENGVYFMVAQVARWWPEFIEIKKYIDGGKLGDIHMIYEKRLCQHPTWSTWHRDPAVSGGGLYDLNVHDIDYLYSLFGLPAKVSAIGWRSPTGCWNHVVAQLTWASGTKAVCETSLEMTGSFPFSIEFRGTGDLGTINYALTAGVNINDDEYGGGSHFTWYPAGSEEVVPLKAEQIDMFAGEIRGFLDAVANGSEVPVPPAESRDVLKIVLAIKESLENGTVVCMD